LLVYQFALRNQETESLTSGGRVCEGRDTDWEALWWRMTREQSLESQGVNMVTVQLNAWD